MKNYEEQLSSEALLLNKYLNQYKHCIGRKRSLERRRDEIIREFNYPIKSILYDGMPHGTGVGTGCAELSFRLDEINTKIDEQVNKSVKVLADIMSVIDFLPENSEERSIIEHKYIDRMSWERICRTENISRTPATKYWRKGLYKLLEFKKVQKIIQEYKESIEK